MRRKDKEIVTRESLLYLIRGREGEGKGRKEGKEEKGKKEGKRELKEKSIGMVGEGKREQ